jgi:1-acyl-sn-glycerol-3-phosphate acyltransferase
VSDATGPEDHGDLIPEVQARVAGALRPLLRRWLDLRVEGQEHVPTAGAVLLAVDAPVARRLARDQHGRPAPGAFPRRPSADGLAGRGSVAATASGMVPLNRGEGDESAMEVLAQLLSDAACIVIYPEGSRSRDGRVHRLRSGLSRLAAAAPHPGRPGRRRRDP